MFPITEFDSRLDPNTMFMNNNESKKSFGDENDYSRKILTVANPEYFSIERGLLYNFMA